MNDAGVTQRLRRGRLVVATPSLVDPNFAHTVILLLDHGADGAVGVVVNRPSGIAVRAALPAWLGTVASPPVVFSGGPVQRDAVIALARVERPSSDGAAILPGVAAVDLGVGEYRPGTVRVFAGYAGWGAGQLEGEVAAGGWFVFDARPDDAFSDDPAGLWLAVIRRQGGLFTAACDDPTRN
ncbi:MAG: YqgE/AlgH family protein [Actinomycetota bacterium]|nr:YqgE/AlgH family protein [Actinomycetota bacterium]